MSVVNVWVVNVLQSFETFTLHSLALLMAILGTSTLVMEARKRKARPRFGKCTKVF